jgi:quercetin dioxygenase-like cupin family protein
MLAIVRTLPLFVITGALLAQRPAPIDNEWVRVVIAQTSPGAPKGRMHQHDVNRVMIYLDKGAQRLEYENGKTKDIPFEAGDVKWDPKGGMHTSQNTGGTAFRIIEIELKKPGGKAQFTNLDPVKVAPSVYKVELDNDQVRVLRGKIGPGQEIPLHEHGLPRLVVPLADFELEVTSTDGKTNTIRLKPGDVVFGQPVTHREKNLRNTPTEVILVELKG